MSAHRRSRLIVLTFGLMSSSWTLAAADKPLPKGEEIMDKFAEATGGEALERIFWKEIQAGNWTEIERVLASNYVGVTPAGSLDRTATLDLYHQWKLTDFAIGDLKTEMTGPTFIVTYTITFNGTAGGQPLPSGPQHMMTVWHEHKSGWMVIAHSVSM